MGYEETLSVILNMKRPCKTTDVNVVSRTLNYPQIVVTEPPENLKSRTVILNMKRPCKTTDVNVVSRTLNHPQIVVTEPPENLKSRTT